MGISPVTARILTTLDTLSAHTLKRRDDLGELLELAAQNDAQDELDRLGFTAKFLTKTHGIMQRIGRNGQGYDQLAKEFSSNMEKACHLIRSLTVPAPAGLREQFHSTYLSLTAESFQHLLSLLHDLGWYKNWSMDVKREGRHRS